MLERAGPALDSKDKLLVLLVHMPEYSNAPPGGVPQAFGTSTGTRPVPGTCGLSSGNGVTPHTTLPSHLTIGNITKPNINLRFPAVPFFRSRLKE